MLNGKKILLIIGGGIAAFKCHDLIRGLREAGASVTPVLTEAGKEFVTPLSISVLSGSKVYSDLFDLEDETQMGHIELSRNSDLIVIVPATADLLAKMASGLANDLASTLLLATDTDVLAAPAMNVRMWEHLATRRNIQLLKKDGIGFIGPVEGSMACGEFGFGRMAEPEQIIAAIKKKLSLGKLKGKHIVVTSGPTHEQIDPVRFIGNLSSGTQGTQIAVALLNEGARVTLISGPTHIELPLGATIKRVESANEMFTEVKKSLPADAFVMVAAVADWKTKEFSKSKIKKNSDKELVLKLIKNPDILEYVSKLRKGRPKLVVGFAAETEDLIANATEKLNRKKCDWIVANDIRPETNIMGGTENAVILISNAGVKKWDRMDKSEVARKLVNLMVEKLNLS